jgi:flagellar L-ring protein precursor FlgH
MRRIMKNKALKIGIKSFRIGIIVGIIGLSHLFNSEIVLSQEILLSQISNQRKFDNIRQRSFISDYKVMGVGDAVLILVVETTEAGNSAGATEGRSSSLSAGAGFGIDNRATNSINSTSNHTSLDLSLKSGNDFKGSGANTRKESIRSQLTAKVIGEDERGNFIIEGKRKTKIDGEEQTITLKGLIRAADVRSDNSIYSYNIMDLELYVEGEGNASKMRQPGLFTKFFRLLF